MYGTNEKSLSTFSHLQQIGGKPILIWRITFVLIPLMRKNEVRLHLFNYVFKLVAINIKDWLSALKHIVTLKYYLYMRNF
jgi:hypothetical protein